ncbi:MAG: sterol desaturase family protein [Proteobacteria bacterium]|nr:sterol desaturase family protein [Pseudomonadota bacterium]
MDQEESYYQPYASVFEMLELIGLAFLVIIVLETLWDFMFGKRKKVGETIANFAIAVVGFVLERSAYGLVFVVGLYLVSPLALTEIPLTWWSWTLALLAADFSYYWMHRWEHEVRILWAHHSVHHSSPEFNLTTSLRLSWVESLIEWIFFVPIVLFGFDPLQVLAAISIVTIYQTLIHTEKVGRLGWLDGILNTPSVHRVHHGANGKYLDKNYGGVLMIWDRMFGTYQKEEEPVIYGLTKQIETANPIRINFHEYVQIFKDLRRAKNFREVCGYLLGGPGWKPNAKPASLE